MAEFLSWVDSVPPVLVYLLLGVGSAVESVVPAIPADTVVALGGFLSAVGDLDARWIFAWSWSFNVGSALVMYRLGYKHGRGFFQHRWGRRVLRPHQMERVAAFYSRFGTVAIFFTRFLPGLRFVVPIFAGVSHQPFLFVALPLAAASAVWYALLIWIGVFAGQNLDALSAMLGQLNGVLLGVAVVGIGGAATWWWRSRQPHASRGEETSGVADVEGTSGE